MGSLRKRKQNGSVDKEALRGGGSRSNTTVTNQEMRSELSFCLLGRNRGVGG